MNIPFKGSLMLIACLGLIQGALGPEAQGAFDCYARFTPYASKTMGGTSKDGQFPGSSGWTGIELTEQGITNLLSIGSQASGTGAGVARFTTFRFTKSVDSATPTFLQMLASGAAFSTVEIVFRQAGVPDNHPSPYYATTLKLVGLQSLNWTNQDGSAPVESVGIQYGQLDWSCTKFDSNGIPTTLVTVNWDQVLNKGTGVQQSSVTPPVLIYPQAQSVANGASLVVNPTAGLTAAAGLDHLTVKSTGGYVGGIAVDPTTGVVKLTQAQPTGGPYAIIIEAVDSNWFATDAAFTLTVNPITPALLANPDQFTRVFGASNTIPVSTLLANDSAGAVFDSLPSQDTELKGRVSLQGSSILYQPPVPDPGLDDTFTYKIRDAYGQTAIGTVTVGISLPGGGPTGNLSIRISDGQIEIQLTGLPAHSYQMQSAQSPTGPWTNLGDPIMADADGLVRWHDAAQQSEVFYRAFNIR